MYALWILLFIAGTRARVVWECTHWDRDDPWGACAWNRGRVNWGEEYTSFVSDPAGSGERVLKIDYERGSYSRNRRGGTQFQARPIGSGLDRATLEYDIYFSPNFDFVKGGKLMGFKGGRGQCSGGIENFSCFSSRFMWRERGDGEIYAYLPNEDGDWFCFTPNVHCDRTWGHSFGRGTWRFRTGRWQRFGQYIKLNTVNGDGSHNSDGEYRIYYEGQEVYRIQGLVFRKSPNNNIKIDILYFSTFFGGGDPSWASSRDVSTYYRNIRIHDGPLN